jgi:hypothetical protein
MKWMSITCFILFFAHSLFAQASNAKVGTAGAQFLKIGLSARATAMGDAFLVVTDNSEAIYWNPGALARLEGRDLSLSYVQWPADIDYSGIAIAANLGSIGTFGVHIAGLKTGDMRVRTIYKPEGDGRMFNATQFSGGLTYATFLTDRFSIGATVKYIQEDFWDLTARNWAVDIGTFYDTGFNSLVLGMSILNFGPEMNFGGNFTDFGDPDEGGSAGDFETRDFGNYPLPLTFRFGLAMTVYRTDDVSVLTALDTNKPNDTQQRINGGVEFTFNDMFSLRTGYKIGYDEDSFSFGAGFNYTITGELNIRFDYAYADMGILDIVHRGSFGVAF